MLSDELLALMLLLLLPRCHLCDNELRYHLQNALHHSVRNVNASLGLVALSFSEKLVRACEMNVCVTPETKVPFPQSRCTSLPHRRGSAVTWINSLQV